MFKTGQEKKKQEFKIKAQKNLQIKGKKNRTKCVNKSPTRGKFVGDVFNVKKIEKELRKGLKCRGREEEQFFCDDSQKWKIIK